MFRCIYLKICQEPFPSLLQMIKKSYRKDLYEAVVVAVYKIWKCPQVLKALKRSRGMVIYVIVRVCVWEDRNLIFNYHFPNAYYVIGIFIYNDTYIIYIMVSF